MSVLGLPSLVFTIPGLTFGFSVRFKSQNVPRSRCQSYNFWTDIYNSWTDIWDLSVLDLVGQFWVFKCQS